MSKNKLKRILLIALSMILLAASAVFTYFRMAVRPTVISMAENKTTSQATVYINECVIDELYGSGRDYSDLVTVQRDAEGNIISVSADPVKTNAMASRLSVAIADSLSSLCDQRVNIPLGNVLNFDLLSGKGPDIPIRVVSVGAVKTKLENTFTAGAINQTLHRIMLSVETKITLYVPFKLTDVDVTAKVCVAETVIVGKVPQAYTFVVESGDSVAGALNDYAAHAP